MLGLERLQFAEQTVVFAVRDLRLIEHVVLVVVSLDVLSQGPQTFHRIGLAGQ